MSETHDPTGPTHATPTPAPQVAPPAPVLEAAAPEAPVPVAIGSLRVGHAEDRAEADADAAADRALSRLAPLSGELHQHGPGCDHVRRTPAADALVGHEGGDLDAATTATIESKRGGGRPMEEGVLRRMESAFGQSFSGVRIHDDPTAAQLNRAVSARAFTTGQDVFFGAGEYAPDSPGGERVLAHELAHTLQNASGAHRTLDAAATRAAAGPTSVREGTPGEADVEAAAMVPPDHAPVPLPLLRSVVEGSQAEPAQASGAESTGSQASEAESSGSEGEEPVYEDEEHYERVHGFDDLATDADFDVDFDEEAAVAALEQSNGDQSDDQEYESEEDYERLHGFDDLSTDADFDVDFDEEAAVAALEQADESTQTVSEQLAQIDAIPLDAASPELATDAPGAAVAMMRDHGAVTAAHVVLPATAPASAVAPVVVAMAAPADAMLADLNDLVVAEMVEADDLVGSLAHGLLDAAAGAVPLTAGGDPTDDAYLAELAPEDVDRLLRAATWLAQRVAAALSDDPAETE